MGNPYVYTYGKNVLKMKLDSSCILKIEELFQGCRDGLIYEKPMFFMTFCFLEVRGLV
jgi:hypothetical protein